MGRRPGRPLVGRLMHKRNGLGKGVARLARVRPPAAPFQREIRARERVVRTVPDERAFGL